MSVVVEQSDPGGLLSMSKVCRHLNLVQTPRQLFELLLQRERESGRTIMTTVGRRGRGERGVRYRVTLKAVRKWCPEFFERSRDELSQAKSGLIRELKRELRERIDEVVKRELNQRLTEIDQKIETLMQTLEKHGVKWVVPTPGSSASDNT